MWGIVFLIIYEELIAHLLEKYESTGNCIIVQITAAWANRVD